VTAGELRRRTAFHSQDRAIEEDVFSASQFRVKTGAHFEQAGDSTAQNRASAIRLGNLTQDFQ
jgi:hypothetical protein